MRFRRSLILLTGLIILLGLMTVTALAQERLRLATTTSTENTGLLNVLLPPFEKAHNVKVDVIAVGTGKALELGRRCDVDILMVHAPELELEFVAAGSGIDRRPLMANYFFLVGPENDPAGVKGAPDLAQALQRIAKAKAAFVSRGDKSGTQVKELALWVAAGIKPDWPGYKEAGQGMGAVLIMSDQLQAYTLTDSATFYKYHGEGKIKLAVLRGQDEALKNPYAVILVNPAKCPQVKTDLARSLADFLVSPQGQEIIAGFRAQGQQLFFPAR